MNDEKRCKNKKGVSPVIATVLLLAMVFVLALFVFLYFRGFLTEQIEKFDKPIDNICQSVNFDIHSRVDGNNMVFDFINRGNIPIYYFNLEKITEDGDSYITPLNISLSSQEGASEEKSFESGVKEVVFYPVLLGTIKGADKSGTFICKDQKKSIKL